MVEKIAAAAAVLLLASLMLWAVVDTRRRARDAERVSLARQGQAIVEAYRARHASYPSGPADVADADNALLTGLAYEAQPTGCGPEKAETCRSYAMRVQLEGRVGSLSGGTCTVTPGGLACAP